MTDTGFNKIELAKEGSTDPENKETVIDKKLTSKTMRPKKPKKVLKIFVFVIVFLLAFSVAMFFPARALYQNVLVTVESAKKVSQALKDQNIEGTKSELVNTREQLKKTSQSYSFFGFTKIIPVVGGYYRDGDHLLKAADAGLEAGEIAVDSLIPYADLLGLKGGSSFVSGSADERIQTAVKTLDKLTPKLGEIATRIEVVKSNLDAINFDKYPKKIGKQEVREKLLSLRQTVDDLSTLFINARPLLENLPSLLGEPDAKKYLVIFQNDKELRPTGGFITAYALFKIEKGKLIVESSDDIYKLDEKNPTKLSPPKQFIDHLKVYKLYLRDTNYDPDFVDSMKRFEEMYNAIPGTTKVDGIIALDTHVLVEAMKILGPIPAYGTNFVIDIDSRCDCPRVIYDLEEYAGQRVGYVREERKDIIGVLLYQIMQKALGVSPSQYWGNLFQMVISEFNQKHILAYLHNEDAQKSLEALDFAGRMNTDFEGDYLHINDANLGGAKSNMFVKNYVKQEYELDKDGSIIKTVTVDYKNPKEGSKGCNLEAGGLCLNGLMPNWVRLYVPKGSTLIDFEGSEDAVTTEEAYGKTVFDGFLTVKPSSVTQIVVKYKLPASINGKVIPLYLQKQPGTEGIENTIVVNGKEVNVFNLIQDKKIDIKF